MGQANQATPFVERLPCKLSPREKELKADELARTVNARDALVFEKSLAAQRFAKSIKELERKVGDLAEEARTGVEYRQVKVTERRDFNQNVVEVIRLDTHEVCGQRAMRADERQLEMLPKHGNGNGNGGDASLQLELTEAEAAESRLVRPDGGVDDEDLGPDDDDDDDFDDDEEPAETDASAH